MNGGIQLTQSVATERNPNARSKAHRGLVALAIVICFTLSSCGGATEEVVGIDQLIPPIPSNTDFGDLYPRLNAILNGSQTNVSAAIDTTRVWAEQRLPEFREAACADTQVVYDDEFVRLFGHKTLGVTLPWMQIYIRDGQRTMLSSDSPTNLWSDASLFASTVLHEYVHALQRKRQAASYFSVTHDAASCKTVQNILLRRRGLWNTGFAILRTSHTLGDGFDTPERTLLYHWVSPIERARDEVEAALYTVRWMSQFPDALNVMTVGGANNWAYALLYLNHLKTLSTSNCFSGDQSAYEEELRVYTEQIPAFVRELTPFEPAMRHFMNTHGLPAVELSLDEFIVQPQPTGRDGHACQALAAELPRYPIKDQRGKRNIRLRPIPFEITIGLEPLESAD